MHLAHFPFDEAMLQNVLVRFHQINLGWTLSRFLLFVYSLALAGHAFDLLKCQICIHLKFLRVRCLYFQLRCGHGLFVVSGRHTCNSQPNSIGS